MPNLLKTPINDLILFLVAGFVFYNWAWIILKINQFTERTHRQKAISKPQIKELRRVTSGRLLLASIPFILFWLGTAVFDPTGEFSVETAVFFSIFCISAPLLLLIAYIWLQTLTLRKAFNYPATNASTVPIPEPPPPPPHHEKSFAQLADELEKELRDNL